MQEMNNNMTGYPGEKLLLLLFRSSVAFIGLAQIHSLLHIQVHPLSTPLLPFWVYLT